MLRIRLSRYGKKRQPSYRVVVADKKNKRDGRFVEQIGFYNPMVDPIDYKIKEDRALHWLSVGAQPSDAVRRLLEKQGTLERLARVHKGESIDALTAEFTGDVVEDAPAVEEAVEEASAVEEVAETADAVEEVTEVVEEAPAAVATEPAVSEEPVAEAEDLTKLEGVGPKISKALAEGGLPTYAAVAAATPEQIKEVLSAASIGANPETWPQQAALAADGKWDELKALQEELDGGRA